MAINIAQAKGVFTKTYLASYQENIPATSFFKSFFAVKTSAAKTVGIEVQRGTERIAVDVLRGASGTRNTFSKSSEKEYMPPFYNEYFDATQLDRYDRIFGASPELSPETIGYLGNEVGLKYATLREKIERAKELQAAQVFETGVVTLSNGDNIDYKRKAGSIVDVSGANPWSTTTTDIEQQLVDGATFIRNYGKNATGVFNLVMSGKEWISIKKSDYFKNNANFNQVKLIDINMPQMNSFGATYHGQISAGSYVFNVWVYDGIYENSAGTITRYFDEKKCFITPVSGARFDFAHAGVPAIMRDVQRAEFSEYIAQVAGEYYLNNYIDPQAKAHLFEIYSAPLAVPVTIDMIYTLKTLV